MSDPGPLLRRTTQEATRRVARAQVARARAAGLRLREPAAAEGGSEVAVEALHDFRVAVRRLRVTLRIWRDPLGRAASRRIRKRLGRIQKSGGAMRDADAALAWLHEQSAGIAPEHRAAYDAWLEHVRSLKVPGRGSTQRKLQREFDKLAAKLEARLSTFQVRVDLDRGPIDERFGQAAAGRVRRESRKLEKRLRGIGGVEDREAAHAARIQCKRLRYLVEPLRGGAAGAEGVVKHCRALQDALGELNDGHVLADLLEADPDGAAIDRAGTKELRRLNEARIASRFEKLEAGWLWGTRLEGLRDGCEALAVRLEQAAGTGLEIERKLLLRSLPDMACLPDGERVACLEISQGWLPGDRIRERLRRVEGAGGTTWLRTLKLGDGLLRTELEEPIEPALFDALWPFTAGCRVRKRRHVFEADGHCWELDEFLDRELVLLEVELARPDEEVAVPDWIAPLVVADVSEDGDYTNLRLAR